ncbi:glycoside hydrolase family 32 protein [Heterobasidion irregulare TC 32-1]|uniref:Glycoside hydrolase family 32 protein n=1 Tax=Heterobasidion irregulare (strain TC 32-1) TaxID=747525 RepID=W4KGQ7_HETIT|nr:glycoside hydrolase family 32 protein [Heterobasidion irregulare TC 32-1]ETW84894.1 glycoside hydrolase family 32 protein [Heterobasidion irregulare TC 32-1]
MIYRAASFRTFLAVLVAASGAEAAKSANGTDNCIVDRTKAPGDLTSCGNNTLFNVWRPRARFIAPSGWMNDPQGLFQRSDGSFHAGYQCNPHHYTWGNISQCAAHSKDLVYWEDFKSWKDSKTIWPSELYDIRGVFDGSIIKNGWEGYPTTIYTSTFTGPLGATASPPESPGTETQSIAYTKDGGASWIKLNFGPQGNPVIYEWPVQNMTGFRDPYAFESPVLKRLLSNSTAFNATGDTFLTISGGVRLDADPNAGPRLYLYRQTSSTDVRRWTYIGELVTLPAHEQLSPWTGNVGINFETAGVTRLNEAGEAFDNGSDATALNLIGYGTEQGRNGSHENHWPLWGAASYSVQSDGSVAAAIDFAGVLDWGRVYAAVPFPVSGNRSVLIGWVYEDDEDLVLAAQRGWQGMFTLFRDLFVKVIRNVDPAAPGLNETGSWKTRKETDGSTSVVTLGQKIVPEILRAYRKESVVSSPAPTTLNGSVGYVPFARQPAAAHYVIQATLVFTGRDADIPKAGFRVRASAEEWTDVYFDPQLEAIVVERQNSSLITTYGTETEVAKLRLWPILRSGQNASAATRQTLNLTLVVDNSVVEVLANDVTALTTRVYPWLASSVGAGFLVRGGNGTGNGTAAVRYERVELWDGLLDAWPGRPEDTSAPLLWDGPVMPLLGGIWDGR